MCLHSAISMISLPLIFITFSRFWLQSEKCTVMNALSFVIHLHWSFIRQIYSRRQLNRLRFSIPRLQNQQYLYRICLAQHTGKSGTGKPSRKAKHSLLDESLRRLIKGCYWISAYCSCKDDQGFCIPVELHWMELPWKSSLLSQEPDNAVRNWNWVEKEIGLKMFALRREIIEAIDILDPL